MKYCKLKPLWITKNSLICYKSIILSGRLETFHVCTLCINFYLIFILLWTILLEYSKDFWYEKLREILALTFYAISPLSLYMTLWGLSHTDKININTLSLVLFITVPGAWKSHMVAVKLFISRDTTSKIMNLQLYQKCLKIFFCFPKMVTRSPVGKPYK